jgi:phosphoribosyl-ATP pyrophosphohydrolase/phosphoribosyl-AMP cyclohydrolase
LARLAYTAAMLINFTPDQVAWDKAADGLVPALIQDADTGQALMLGYMSRASLQATIDIGKATFFSRSKQRLWTKGESSQNYLLVQDIRLDCDADTLLVKARPQGPTCHTGNHSCWAEQPAGRTAWLSHLEAIVQQRAKADPQDSYTASLMARGTKRIAQKVGEEGVETALAAMAKDREELINESADLLFHLTVLLYDAGLCLDDVVACLQERHKG